MKYITLVLIGLIFFSCSSVSLQRKSPVQFKTLFIGKITKKENIILESKEKKGERIAVGFATAGLVGVVATSNTEKNFDEPSAFLYTIRTIDKKFIEIKSHSIEDIGDCVEVISPNNTNLKVLIKINAEECKENKKFNKPNIINKKLLNF